MLMHSFSSSLSGIAVSALLLLNMSVAVAEDVFPLRGEYKDVPIIDGEKFRNSLADVTVVDVRSDFEFHILHIQGAINIAVGDPRFPIMIQEARNALGKPLVFYCNGKTCRKSYMAGRAAQHVNLKDSKTYDGGIAAWAHQNPELTELLGSPLTNAERLISPEKLEAHMLSAEEFTSRATKSLVMDVRSPLERAGLSLFVGRERSIPLHKRRKLDRYIQKALDQELPLLAYDASGQEVPWLQYYLEAKGVKDYWFMKNGAEGFFEYLKSAP